MKNYADEQWLNYITWFIFKILTVLLENSSLFNNPSKY